MTVRYTDHVVCLPNSNKFIQIIVLFKLSMIIIHVIVKIKALVMCTEDWYVELCDLDIQIAHAIQTNEKKKYRNFIKLIFW